MLDPRDWRRSGPFFVALLFYGTLLTAYLSAWLAQHVRHPVLYVPGLIGAFYGAGHVVYYIARLF